jgi:DNA invertase Pin-like site-specific DNA recombinase
MASVAQKAAKDISDSTKRGLAAKKARGFQLGNPQNFTQASRRLGSETVRRNAQENTANKQARRLAMLMRENGYTLETIAQELNANGYATRRGKQFFKNTVRLLLLTKPVALPVSAG